MADCKSEKQQSWVTHRAWCWDCVTQSSPEFKNVAPSCDQSAWGKTGSAGLCPSERERESKTEWEKGKERGKGCWCVYVSRALGHDTKLPLNQAAVGCRTDIIFNEIITNTEKNALVRECTFHAGDLGKCGTNRHDLASCPHLPLSSSLSV